MNSKVDIYFDNLKKWIPELKKLREVCLSCGLDEDLKWGSPTYLHEGKNIVSMRGFKEHFAFWFFKGVFLKDSYKILVQSTENTQGLRQIRFNSMDEILKIENEIREYIFEAIDIEKSGIKVEAKKTSEIEICDELKNEIQRNPAFASAFNGLTPGRKKEYSRYISEAKQAKTRASRLEKCIPLVVAGKGLYDKYSC